MQAHPAADKPALDDHRLEAWLHAGVLARFHHEKLSVSRHGFVLVGCGDCDRRPGYLRPLGLVHSRQHYLMSNGGPLSMGHRSPLNWRRGFDGRDHSAGMVLIGDITLACRNKAMSDVFLVVHDPCAAAHLAELDAVDMLTHIVSAADELSTAYSLSVVGAESEPVRIAGLWHRYKDGHDEVYMIDFEAAARWLAQKPT